MIERSYFQSLRGKITNRTLFIGLVPILLLGSLGYVGLTNLLDNAQTQIESSRDKLLDEVVGSNLAATANRVAHQLDEFMLERISDVTTWAAAPTVVAAARDAAQEHENRNLTNLSIEAVENQFSNRKTLGLFREAQNYLVDQVEKSVHFGEIFFTDVNGYNVALTNPTSDFVQSDEGWWTDAFENGISLGQVEFDDSAGIWSVEVSVRITDQNTGRNVGVMKAVLGVSLIQEVSDLRASEISSGNVTVINNTGELLAETNSRHAANRIMNPEVNLKNAQDANARKIFGGDELGFVLGDQQVIGFSKSAPAEFYNTVVENFPGFDWTIMVQQPTAVAFSPLAGLGEVQSNLETSRKNLLYILIGAFVLVLILAIFIANLLSKGIITPIKQLQELAEYVSKGDTRRPIEINSNDEIQDLAQIFDRMRSSIEILFNRYRKLKQDTGTN